MAFKIAARTILHLGSELISSDGIAFYELIKNAFDAGSKRVFIDIVIRIPYEHYSNFIEEALQESSIKELKSLKKRIIEQIDFQAVDAQELENDINDCTSHSELLDVLGDSNFIRIKDSGDGMSLTELDDIYLTIGTRSRYTQKQALLKNSNNIEDSIESSIVPILGEKGVGRLSAMRLGQKLKVKTTKAAEKTYSLLTIDWGLFSHESDQLLHEIPFEPQKGRKKKDIEYSGTTILISRLETEWSVSKIEDIVQDEFNKLIDPFQSNKPRIIVKFNGEKIEIPPFDERLFENAHASVQAELSFLKTDSKKEPVITGNINYHNHKRKKAIHIKSTDIISSAFSRKGKKDNINERIPINPILYIQSLGPFKVNFYWYNRQLLRAIDDIGDKKQVLKLVNHWAGGLKVYRDGFRVNPYGNYDDDWLDLDRKAFSSSGYKVNKQQIIGKVDISSLRNPKLVDQTNREGLRGCTEKDIFINLLRHILTDEFKGFIQEVDDEVRAITPITLEDLEERLEDRRKMIDRSFKYLLQEHPEIQDTSGHLIKDIKESIGQIKNTIVEANDIAESYEKSHGLMLHLAGLGQMVEIISHELNRATEHALKEFNNKNINSIEQLETLQAQLITLNKRLRVLDPLDARARQTKQKTDLISWTQKNLDYHEGQFKRHGIVTNLTVRPSKDSSKFNVKLVQGMMVQILENLISNSVYWLKLEKIIGRKFKPSINVVINTHTRQILFSDNGPGIEWERREEVFEPFRTTKPPGDGKGLGLYIAREIAKYHGISLSLLYEKEEESSVSSTFVIDLGESKE